MRRGIIYLLVLILLLIAPSGIRYLRYYELGGPERSAPPVYEPEQIASVPTPDSTEYTDVPEVGQGLVLIDNAHRNNFTMEEIAYLDSRIAARGFELRQYTEGDLAAALRAVTAYVVIAPLDSFSSEQVLAVSDFVDRGGRLLLIGDPTRFNVIFEEEEAIELEFTLETDEIPLNSLANEFGIIFHGDYLYNTVQNEGNFRNIILRGEGLSEDDLVDGVGQLVFYSTHSLQTGPEGRSLLMGDDDTWSSATDRPGGLILAATSARDRVLAVGDVHFLIEPYFTVNDNSRFIANIADFLVKPADKEYVLADFPFFFGRSIDLIYIDAPELGPDAFDEIIALQDAFRGIDQELQLSAAQHPDRDSLFLGLYNQSEPVSDILASYGISLTIQPPILSKSELQETVQEDESEEEGAAGDEQEPSETVEEKRLIHSDAGIVQMSGTALVLFDESDGRNQVLVLASSNQGLENSVNRLLDLIALDAQHVLDDCLIQSALALCPTNVIDEEVEAELDTGGTPEPVEEEAVEVEEAEEETEEEGAETEGDDQESGAVSQGAINLGESAQAMLEEEEIHSWAFSEGPVTIDILVTSTDLDIVLELYGPDDDLIDSADAEFTGGGEQLQDVEIPDEETYAVHVRDFFGSSGTYTLTVNLAEENGETSGGIFVFADDDGEPLSDGATSLEQLADLLSDDHPVATWVSTVDGPLEDSVLDGYELVVWDSGDYRDEDGFLDADTAVLLEYADGGGDLFIVGASPTIMGDSDLGQLTDLEVGGDDPLLLADLSPGQIIELNQPYDTVVPEPLALDSDEDTDVFLLRGPNSFESGGLAGVATLDESIDQRVAILLAPFYSLPLEIQETILANLLAWFELDDGS